MVRLLILLLLSFTCVSIATSQVRLPRLVRDSMVVQRDAKLKIWGWAAAGEKVNVRFNGRSYRTTTGSDGRWIVTMVPVKAGGPYTMEIVGSNRIILRDILAGDVWLCSGQSNMYHNLGLHADFYAKEMAEADHPQIRQFAVPLNVKLDRPQEDYTAGSWKPATRGHINEFSVVAYFFAKALYDKYQVPIGIIHASYGGSTGEAWVSEDGLREFPHFLKTVNQNRDTAYMNSIRRDEQMRRLRERNKPLVDAGLTGPVKWYDPAYTPKGWSRISIPGFWEDQGTRELDGVVWYRREIEVPAEMTGVPATINLGRIVDADQLYINGEQAGSTGYQYPQRRYNVRAGVLKPGRNLFVVRVVNHSGKGGFVPDKPYFIAANGKTVDLKGYWEYRVGEVFEKRPAEPEFIGRNQPTGLYNGMLYPMLNYALKGFVWYQGESNATRAVEYRKLLPALITDWRARFKQGDLPFLGVQLPEFMEVDYYPVESDWAMFREAQLASLKLPGTAVVVTLGLGEWNDIHPDNKKPIGDRLALAARAVAYGEAGLVYSGPLYQSYRVNGSRVIVSFSHTGNGLITNDGEALQRFEVAGEDRKFVRANAVINGNSVEVWSDEIPSPRYVRYAWADNPKGANLYNKEGLPASPFRTDQ